MKHVVSSQVPHRLGPPLDGSLIQAGVLMSLGTVVEIVCVYREELAPG